MCLWNVIKAMNFSWIKPVSATDDSSISTIAPAGPPAGPQSDSRVVGEGKSRSGMIYKLKLATDDRASAYLTFRDCGTQALVHEQTPGGFTDINSDLANAGYSWTSVVLFHDVQLRPVNPRLWVMSSNVDREILRAYGVIEKESGGGNKPYLINLSLSPLFCEKTPGASYIESKSQAAQLKSDLDEARKVLSAGRAWLKKQHSSAQALITALGSEKAETLFPTMRWSSSEKTHSYAESAKHDDMVTVAIPYTSFRFDLDPAPAVTPFDTSGVRWKEGRAYAYDTNKLYELALKEKVLSSMWKRISQDVACTEYALLSTSRSQRWDVIDSSGNPVAVKLYTCPDATYKSRCLPQVAERFCAKVPGATVVGSAQLAEP